MSKRKELVLTEFGNVDCRNGFPKWYIKTNTHIQRLKAAGVKYYKGLLEFKKVGRYWKPVLVTIIHKNDQRVLEEYRAKKKTQKTEEEKIQAWCRRLDKLTDCGLEEARDIADAKLNDKYKRIDELEQRQITFYSVKREKLINKIHRENPLRYIKDIFHAKRILEAHDRHTNTDYEYLLAMYHEMEDYGMMERGMAREFARRDFVRI